MIQEERIRNLNKAPVQKGRYVLYWMQQSQREATNHALEYAIDRANEQGVPVVAYFGLTSAFPEANLRHYHFMLQGLETVRQRLADRGIRLVLKETAPPEGAVRLAAGATMVVTDRGYLGVQREWRREADRRMPCRFVQVESDVVVPVETAYPKEAYSAGVLRPKLTAHLERFLVPLERRRVQHPSLSLTLRGFPPLDPLDLIGRLKVDKAVPPVGWLTGGEAAAQERLTVFIDSRLDQVPALRNDPSANCLSDLGPYLHFGQISPLAVALAIRATGSPGMDVFLEEVIVRRELAMNYAFYNPDYDRYEGLPQWARNTLADHRDDPRDPCYSSGDLESANTEDLYWNAAQQELLVRGKIHGYMRMYWGKKILEWSASPEEAFATALSLNNRYSLDGRDPNGFAGVAWCFGKHDRAWKERPVFGKVRYMNSRGLERKFNMAGYLERVAGMTGENAGRRDKGGKK
jgi:deoxyribodipyrimidine photo-lyase